MLSSPHSLSYFIILETLIVTNLVPIAQMRKVGLEFTPRWIDSGVSQVAQWLQNLSTRQEMMEIQVQFLGGEDPLEEGMGTPSSILAWRIRGQRRLVDHSR